MALNIKTGAETEFDFLALGECMIRLSPPGRQRIESTPFFEAYAGGAEYNAAYALARFGLRAGWISRLVDNPLGAFIRNHARSSGMDLSEVLWTADDGVGRAERIGLNFTEVGSGVRPSATMYDRGHTAVSHMAPGDADWDRIFGRRRVRWFHTGGVFAALGSSCAETARTAMASARANGAIVSYDLNFRSKLWSSRDAIAANRKLMPLVDVLIGNEEDFQKALGFEVEGADAALTRLPIEGYRALAGRVAAAFPNVGVVGTTLREVATAGRNHWSAILLAEGAVFESRRYENLEIEDRVGGGDGFCSGIIWGFLNGLSPQDCVEMGAAHGALVQTTRGDVSMATLEEVRRVMRGESARIRR